MTTQQSSVLVTGGTGKTGHRVVKGLQQRKIPVRIGSRSTSPAFDWQDNSTWQAALADVDAVYLTFYPDLAVPGATDAIQHFCQLAKQEGVQHIVLLSGRGEVEAQRCESIVQNSGLDWTIIRASWFFQNFSEGAFINAVKSGVLAFPVNDVVEPFIDVDDIADIALAALTDDKHKGQLYEVTGPRLLSFAEIAQTLTVQLGRDVRFVPITLEQFSTALTEQQVPDEAIQLLIYLFSEVLDGRNAHITDGVQRALGRPARDFNDYVKHQAAQGVWDI